jgi:hypothetical protein
VYLKRVPGVRIPLSPQTKLLPQLAAGFFIHRWTNQACPNEDRYELKNLMSETDKGVIWNARFSPMGSLKIIPLSLYLAPSGLYYIYMSLPLAFTGIIISSH